MLVCFFYLQIHSHSCCVLSTFVPTEHASPVKSSSAFWLPSLPLLPQLPQNSSTQYMTLSLPLYRGLARLCSKVYLLVAHSSPFCATSAHATEPCLLNLNVARLASPISADRAIFFEPQTRSTCKITTLLLPRAILARVPYKQIKQPSLPAPAPSRPIKPRPYEKLPSRLHRRN